ncbi:MAG: BON domain-containing protein [Planctomycetaceae bacterium]
MTLPRSPRYFDLNSRIHDALFRGPHFLSGDVRAELQDDEVVLTGVVASYYQKQLAQESVRRVTGVSRVHNELQVAARFRPANVDG